MRWLSSKTIVAVGLVAAFWTGFAYFNSWEDEVNYVHSEANAKASRVDTLNEEAKIIYPPRVYPETLIGACEELLQFLKEEEELLTKKPFGLSLTPSQKTRLKWCRETKIGALEEIGRMKAIEASRNITR